MKKHEESLRDSWTNISIMGISEGQETKNGIVMDWMFVSYPNSYVEILASKEIVRGHGILGGD